MTVRPVFSAVGQRYGWLAIGHGRFFIGFRLQTDLPDSQPAGFSQPKGSARRMLQKKPAIEPSRIRIKKWMFCAIAVLSAVLLMGCSTSSAPHIKGRWKPVNRFAEKTEAVPLDSAYIFYAAPTDGTLKAMLSRWASDSNRKLSYRHSQDFTLHIPVADIRTSDLEQALSSLALLYDAHRVSIALEGDRIVVGEEGH